MRQPVSTARIVIASGAMVAVAAALIGRTVDLQATPDNRILNEVYIPLGVVTVPAPRGDVVDRHGRTIALSLPAATIVVDPRLVVDAAGTAAALSPLLEVSEADLVEDLSGDGLSPILRDN